MGRDRGKRKSLSAVDKLFHLLLYLYLFALNLLVTHYFISIDSPLYQILRLKRDDWTKWTDEASGAYIQYSSIAEEGSVSLIKSTFANAPSLCKLWNKSHIANRTSLTLVLLVHGLNCTNVSEHWQKPNKP